jgi:hypothetical protein
MSSEDQPMLTVAEWLARRPTQAESVRDEVEPFRHMTPEERLEWFVKLQKSMDAFVRLQGPMPDPPEDDFVKRWRDCLNGPAG